MRAMGGLLPALLVLLLLATASYAMWTEVLDTYVVDNNGKPVPGATITITYQRTNPSSKTDGVISGTTGADGKFGTSIRNMVPSVKATVHDVYEPVNEEVRTYTVRASTYFWASEEMTLMQGEDYVGTRRILVFKAPVVMQTVYIYARDAEGYGLADVPLKITSPVAASLTSDGKGNAVYKIPNTYSLTVSGTYKGATATGTSPSYDQSGLQSTNGLLAPYGISFSSGAQFGDVTVINANFSSSSIRRLVDAGAGATSLSLSSHAIPIASENSSVKAAVVSDMFATGRVVALDSSFVNDNSIDQGDNLQFSANALGWLLAHNRNFSRNDICIDSLGLGNRYSGLVKISNEMVGKGYIVIGTTEIPEGNESREITAAALERCNVLVTDRRGISNEHPPYSAAEVSAIQAFVSSNHSLLVSHEPGYTRDSEVELRFEVYAERTLAVQVLDSTGKPLSGVSITEATRGATMLTDENGRARFDGLSRRETTLSFTANGIAVSENASLPYNSNDKSIQLPALLNISDTAASAAGANCVLVSANIIDPRADAAIKAEAQYSGGAGGVLLEQNGSVFSGKVCQNITKKVRIVAYDQYDRVGKEIDISGIEEEPVGIPFVPGEKPKGFVLPDVGRVVSSNIVAIAAILVVLAILYIVRDSVIYAVSCAVKYVRRKK